MNMLAAAYIKCTV